MSHAVPTYNNISTASRDLKEAQKITTRRAAASVLLQLISEASVRSRLTEESFKIAKLKKCRDLREPLREAYRTALDAAISACRKTLLGKEKKTEEDIILPFKILFHADSESDAILTTKKKKQYEDYIDCEPFTFEHYDRYKGTNTTQKNFSNNHVKELLEYCLECLGNEMICTICEAELINILVKLCSRADYVVTFHPRYDFLDILQAIQPRLVGQTLLAHNASKVLYNLIHTMIVTLEIQIHAFVQPCLALALDWIRCQEIGYFADASLSFIYNSISDILTNYPEQCSRILAQDNFGKDFFDFARKCWNSTKDNNRDALVGYFSSHIYVCEIVGRSQGLLQGDLGDAGSASIDDARLRILCKLVLSDSSLEVYSSTSTAVEQDFGNKSKFISLNMNMQKNKKIRRSKDVIEWVPLVKRQRRYLELCAKLVRYSQRAFTLTVELNSRQKTCDNQYGLSSENVEKEFSTSEPTIDSPFFSLIARNCFGYVISVLQAKKVIESNEQAAQSNNMFDLPLMRAFLNTDAQRHIDNSKIVIYLQLLSACAESYPRGECWASTNTLKGILDDKRAIDLRNSYVHVCEGSDLSFVIFSLSLLLEMFGGAGADSRIQSWVLVCLLKLSDATNFWMQYCSDLKEQVERISLSWINVWNELCNSDLRYQAYTSAAYENSIGELVIMLLGEIVRNNFTEPDLLYTPKDQLRRNSSPSLFITKKQNQIWNLPLFASTTYTHSSAPFDLIHSILYRIVLDDGGKDLINAKSAAGLFDSKSRRNRIAFYCLDFLTKMMRGNDLTSFRKAVPFVASAFIALSTSKCSTDINLTNYGIKRFRTLRITDIEVPNHKSNMNSGDHLTCILWRDSFNSISFADYCGNSELIRKHFAGDTNTFYNQLEPSEVAKISLELERVFGFCHSHSTSFKSTGIQKMMFSVLGEIFESQHIADNEGDESCDEYVDFLTRQTLLLKFLLSVSLSGDGAIQNQIPRPLETYVEHVLLNFSKVRETLWSSEAYAVLTLEIIGVARLIRQGMISNFHHMRNLIRDQHLHQLYSHCREIMTKLGNTDNVFSKDREVSIPSSYRKRKLLHESDFDDSDDEITVAKESRFVSRNVIDNIMGVPKNGDGKAKFLAAAIMSILSPSFRTASFIVDIFIVSNDQLPEYESGDPFECLICTGLLAEFYHFYDDKSESSSTPYKLCLDMIQKFHQAATNSSPFHLSGFECCSVIFEKRMEINMHRPMSDDEITSTLEMFVKNNSEESRSLNTRPKIKAMQILSATKILLVADTNFNKLFGDIFAKTFVMEALNDLSAHVRRAGIQAMVAALVTFPQSAHEKISKDVIRVFPSSPLLHYETIEQKSFQQFVHRKTAKVDTHFQELERRAWYENQFALEIDKIDCIGMIGCRSEYSVSVQMFTSLVNISKQRNWTARAFLMMEKISKERGFEHLEQYINDMQFVIIHSWIKGKNLLISLPLSFTSPRLFREIRRINTFCQFNDDTSLHTNLAEKTAKEFVSGHASVLVPCVFVTFSDLFDDDKYDLFSHVLSKTSSKIYADAFIENVLIEIASVCSNGRLETLIKRHYHDIFAHIIPLHLITTNANFVLDERGKNMLDCLSKVCKNVKLLLSNEAHVIATTLIKNGCSGRYPYVGLNVTQKNYIDSLEYLSFFLDEKGSFTENKDIFVYSQTSVKECILQSMMIMHSHRKEDRKVSSWGLLEEIIQRISKSPDTYMKELRFCVMSLLNVIKQSQVYSISICVCALAQLKTLVSCLQSFSDCDVFSSITPFLNEIISQLLQLHKEFIFSGVEDCVLKSKQIEKLKMCVVDLSCEIVIDDLSHVNTSSDSYIWLEKKSIEQYHMHSSATFECANLAFECLELLLDATAPFLSEDLFAIDDFPQRMMSPSSLKVLSRLNIKADLSTIFEPRIRAPQRDSQCPDLKSTILQFVNTSKRCRSRNLYGNTTASSSTQERALLNSLERLLTEIHRLKSHSETYVARGALEELYLLLNPRFSTEIQFSSLQCIEEIIFNCDVDIGQESSVIDSVFLQDPLSHIYEDSLSLVSDFLLSESPEIAIAAKETAKALMNTKDGKRAFNQVSSTVVVDSLSAFVNIYPNGRNKFPMVSDSFLSGLCRCVKLPEEEVLIDKSWCWKETLWSPPLDERMSFDIWIRNLVSALIICCYCNTERATTVLVSGNSDFFNACLSLSSREHHFAMTLFPAIVYDLLNSDSSDDHTNHLECIRDHIIGKPFSLANQYLSRCFSIALQTYTQIGQKSLDDDSLKLLLRTIDLLRQVTEHRFYNLKFQDNVNSVRGRKYSSKEGSFNVPPEWYTEMLPSSPEWRGRPYGIVLQLSVKDIVRAFLTVKDFHSALYYTEFFADNQLGSSSCLFEKIECISVSPSGISGFGISQEMSRKLSVLNCRELDEDQSDTAICIHHLLSKCYAGLYELELISGLEEAVTKLQFQRPDAFIEFPFESTAIISGHNPVHAIMKLDRYIDSSVEKGLLFLEGIGQMGMYNTRDWCLSGIDSFELYDSANISDKKKIKEMRAEQSWRKLQSSLDRNVRSDSSDVLEDGYHSLLFKSITSLVDGDELAFEKSLAQTREALIRDSYLSSKYPFLHKVNEYILKVSTLNEMKDLNSVLKGTMPVQNWYERYEIKNETRERALFKDLEMRLSIKEIFSKILHGKFSSDGDDVYSRMIRSIIFNICGLAREHDRPNIAIAALSRLKAFQSSDSMIHSVSSNRMQVLELRFEESKNLYHSGDKTAAVRICKETIRNLNILAKEVVEAESLLVDAQVQCASWLIRHPIDSSASLLEDLLIPSVELSKRINERQKTLHSSQQMARASFLFGEFTADLFDNLENRMSSEEWKKMLIAAEGRRKEYIDNEGIAKQLMNKMKKGLQLSKEEKHQISSISHLKKEVDYDTKERLELDRSLSSYIMQSIDAFGVALSCCSCSSQEIKHVFRFMSLWFKNAYGKHGENVNETIENKLSKIPSFHFVPLLYQICSRIDSISSLSGNNSRFQSILQTLIKRICIDHPYHGLIQLIGMSKGEPHTSSNNGTILGGKISAAEMLLKDIEKNAPLFVAELAMSYIILTNSYTALALHDTSNLIQQNYTKNIPISSLKIPGGSRNTILKCLKGRSKFLPCVITCIPQIRPNADYGNGDEDPVGSERINFFESIFSITDSGIHRPKIIVCVGMKGGRYRQLVKGEDDIRQDAIMQQVFSTVNQLFRSKSNITRSLKIAGYSCVPVSQNCGVLQWVENTIPFGEYLIPRRNEKSAHTRYYPGEWTQTLCRNHITHAPDDLKRAAFDEICRHFSPAFRFFFLEKFSQSLQQWHSARMLYTRSCAVNSFVGHILGIGDRHPGNILVHEKSGELVHIDFGYVFDQSKLLPCPETIPFRLTRDIIDGMGPLGTEGPFTEAARTTMNILRENVSTLMTILSAVVADPLYKWCVNPQKLRQHQREVEETEDATDIGEDIYHSSNLTENDNDAALRAIGKIKQKLTGFEENVGEQQTVEGQLRLLMNAAQDPDKLCKLFGGWSAWV